MKKVTMPVVIACCVTAGLLWIPRVASGQNEQKAAASGLRQDMRELWSDHVIWTRDYILAVAAAAPDRQAAATRLMKNQEDIGNAVANYYGNAAGDKLTAVLKDHTSIAVDLIKAAKADDQAGE